jgi:hypothetical protein
MGAGVPLKARATVVVKAIAEKAMAGRAAADKAATDKTAADKGVCHTLVPKSRTEASIRVPRMFNHTHSDNMINR